MYQKGKEFLKDGVDGVDRKKDRSNDLHGAGTKLGI